MTAAYLLAEYAEGVLLSVKAQPNSKKNEIRGIQNNMLKVCITQIAEKGKANKAVIKELAKFFGLRTSQIELVSGDISPQKKFLIRDADIKQLQKFIDGSNGTFPPFPHK
jgi:uncharacterized protein (TIGR00251 family)